MIVCRRNCDICKELAGLIVDGKQVLLEQQCSEHGLPKRIDESAAQEVYGTTVETKRANFHKFADLISNQFNHGGDKYQLPGFTDREATDVISAVFGGKSQFDWILGTMMKYLFRFKNFEREKDLLKVATYCYILWLKQGNHLKDNHDEDTKK